VWGMEKSEEDVTWKTLGLKTPTFALVIIKWELLGMEAADDGGSKGKSLVLSYEIDWVLQVSLLVADTSNWNNSKRHIICFSIRRGNVTLTKGLVFRVKRNKLSLKITWKEIYVFLEGEPHISFVICTIT